MIQTESVVKDIMLEAQVINQYMRDDLTRLKPDIDDLLFQVLDYGLFNGGKRVRPLLVVLSSRLCGNPDPDVYKLGCAFEYLHTATLFHDDLIDNSDIRRGKPSIHKQFGTIAAILAGDYLHALSMSTVGKFTGSGGLEPFCKATTGMVDGEFMQLRNATKHNLSELDYRDAIIGKTGLLIAAACEVGAIYGGGDEQRVVALKEYGINLGCAFQIIDDLLDYLGDPEKTGKAVGNDLAEGKMTLPLILTLANARETDKARILTILDDKNLRLESFTEIYDLIVGYGGFVAAKTKAVGAVNNALEGLTIFSEESARAERKVLEGLARYVLAREK